MSADIRRAALEEAAAIVDESAVEFEKQASTASDGQVHDAMMMASDALELTAIAIRERAQDVALDRCPICLEVFKHDDLCASDITEGTCHAACLEGSPVVDLQTGEETGGEIDTYRFSEVMDPEPNSAGIAAAMEYVTSIAADIDTAEVTEVIRRFLAVETPPPQPLSVGSGDTIMKADVEKMIRDWQAECADHPALHNQGNVLLDRLKSMKPSLAMNDFLTGMNSIADQAAAEAVTFSSDEDALDLLERYGYKEAQNGVIREDWRCFNAECRAAVNYLCEEWDFVFEDTAPPPPAERETREVVSG